MNRRNRRIGYHSSISGQPAALLQAPRKVEGKRKGIPATHFFLIAVVLACAQVVFVFRPQLQGTPVSLSQDFAYPTSPTQKAAYEGLRVVLVANEFIQQFPLSGYGGVEAHVEAEAEGLARVGTVHFTVITPKITQQRRQYNFTIIETEQKARTPPKIWIQEVKRLIRQMDPPPDIVWSQSDWSAKGLHGLGIPMIVTHSDSKRSDTTLQIKLEYYPHVLNRFISHNQREHWCQAMPWLVNNSFVQWYGFSQEEFDLEINKTPKTLLFVGQLNQAKGLNDFVKLAEWNPDWNFEMYGPGQTPRLAKLPNLHFHGELQRGAEHRQAFARASKFFMFVHHEEGFGRVIVEALSKGTPVLGSARGSLPELITQQVGVVSNDLTVINQTLRKDFDPRIVFEYARQNFDSVGEVKKMLQKSVDFIQEIKKGRGGASVGL